MLTYSLSCGNWFFRHERIAGSVTVYCCDSEVPGRIDLQIFDFHVGGIALGRSDLRSIIDRSANIVFTLN